MLMSVRNGGQAGRAFFQKFLHEIEPDQPNLIELVEACQQLQAGFGLSKDPTPGTMDILGWNLEYFSGSALCSNIDQIMIKRLNDFKADCSDPLILDCGANIGLSALHYRRLYPDSRIIAFEPDPVFLPVLRKNLNNNNAGDIEVVDAAVWTSNGLLDWHCEGAGGSKNVDGHSTNEGVLKVRSVDLRDFLNQAVDFLKISIGGAENDVISHIAPMLKNVKAISLDCHVCHTNISAFNRTIETLHAAGFSLSINPFSVWDDFIRHPLKPTEDHFGAYMCVSAWRGEISKASHGVTSFSHSGLHSLLPLKKFLDPRLIALRPPIKYLDTAVIFSDRLTEEENVILMKYFWLISLFAKSVFWTYENLGIMWATKFTERMSRSIKQKGVVGFLRIGVWPKCMRFIRRVIIRIAYGFDCASPRLKPLLEVKAFPEVRPLSNEGLNGKPSVCLVTCSMSSGGAERQVATLAVELKKRNYNVRVRVMSLAGDDAHYLKFLKANGIDVSVPSVSVLSMRLYMLQHDINPDIFLSVPAELRLEAFCLVYDLLKRPVDVLHCYLDLACCYGGFAGLLCAVPKIRLSWRNVNPSRFEFYYDWMPQFYQFFSSFPNISFENNTQNGALDYANWLAWDSSKISVMPNGISPEIFSSSPEAVAQIQKKVSVNGKTALIVSICRLSEEKRPLDLPAILVEVQRSIPEASLIHVGSGLMKDSFEDSISCNELNPSTAVQQGRGALFLYGRRSDVFDILKAADVFLLTSEHEGMPNVIMEAMLAGLPIVASRVGGVPDLITDGVNGFLHTAGDISGMAKSIECLLNNPDLAQRMGQSGRERILSEFTATHMASRVINSYLHSQSTSICNKQK